MPADNPVAKIMADADRTLRSTVSDSAIGEVDPRWQAIIRVAEFVETNPDEVWNFISHWGCSDNTDLRTAVATCLLEHLLERHFEATFPKARTLAFQNRNFADTVGRVWSLGRAERPHNESLWRALQESLRTSV
jgi:hypothetical protein